MDDSTNIEGRIDRSLKELEVESSEKFGSDEEKQRVAAKCLKHLNNWMTSSYVAGLTYTRNDKRRLKRDCYESVRQSVIKDYKEEYGFAILSYLLIFVILPMVLKWLIERLFSKLS